MLRRITHLSEKSARLRKQTIYKASFLNGGNSVYVEQMYVSWLQDKSSVHASWNAYFENLSVVGDPEAAFISPEQAMSSGFNLGSVQAQSGGSPLLSKAEKMAHQFRRFGHQIADLDPLGMERQESSLEALKLGPESFFNREEIDSQIDLSRSEDPLLRSLGRVTPNEVAENLKKAYCGTLGFEFEHINDQATRLWAQAKAESYSNFSLTKEEHSKVLDNILESQAFSYFCDAKFSTLKRFGCDGIDSSVAAIGEIVREFHKYGGNRTVIGMAHRSRLNILTTILNKPYELMFSEFLESTPDFHVEHVPDFYSDVKYHNGYSDLQTDELTGNQMQVEMLPNPSHLEAVNMVVAGYCYGHARELSSSQQNDISTNNSVPKILPVVIHGDAAMAGQGIVYEALQMEKLDGYDVGGTVHVCFNNQVGFTTNPKNARTFDNASDIAKANNNLIIRVNGDDVNAVMFAMRAAVEYRCLFAKDAFVEIIAYRKYGHNEQDNPRFTQPVMYKKVEAMKPAYQKYSDYLTANNIFSSEEIDSRMNHFKKNVIEAQFEKVRNQEFNPENWVTGKNYFNEAQPTGVSPEMLKEIGSKIFDIESIELNVDRTLKRLYKNALKSIEDGQGIEWGTAELLAYGVSLNEGHHLRLSGEDVERGTFSHRQAVLVDQQNGKKVFPLSRVLPANASNESDAVANLQRDQITIINSLLSEYAVLAFDYGHSLSRPNGINIWEAQFGDFANGAQIVIDQFITSGEKKWRNFSNLIMMLPHGYDGMGPEHSNARIERFLNNVDDDYLQVEEDPEYLASLPDRANMSVYNITSPANYFHALRGQVKKSHRKPMIVMTPKRLLKFKEVKSSLSEFAADKTFRPVLPDENPDLDKSKVEKVIICSGQVYFDLKAKRAELGLEDKVAIIRLERLGPFPYKEFKETMEGFDSQVGMTFVSEEQMNFGAFHYVQPRANLVLDQAGFDNELEYVGRRVSSSSSTGKLGKHAKELDQLLKKAFEL